MNKSFRQVLFYKNFYNHISSERFYGRWMHRTPGKTILPFDGSSLRKEKIIELDPKKLTKSREEEIPNSDKDSHINRNETFQSAPTKISTFPIEKIKKIKQNRDTKIAETKKSINKLSVFDENNEVIYEKLKENDGRISSLLIKLKSKKERGLSSQVLVEGWRLILDGIKAKCQIRYIIFSRIEDLNKIQSMLPKTGVRIYKIPYKEIQMWSDVDTSPGIFGVFDTPTQNNIKRISKPLPIQIVCDNIRIPGNLGAILRAAVGVGCQNVYLMKGCVDYWDPKVVRSAAGAHFQLPVHTNLTWDNLPNLIGQNTSVFIADNNTSHEADEVHDDGSSIYSEPNILINIPVIPYYSVEFSSLESTTLIIGGETEGISEDCYRFAVKKNGLRLNIPLQKGVDSLNSGMAAAVISFEIKKQILQARATYSTKLNNDEEVAR